MQLTLFTDYSLRVIIYLSRNGNKSSTKNEIAEWYGISAQHLNKIIHFLSKNGYIQSTKGKGGGIKLAIPAKQINVADLVQKAEFNLNLVECFDPKTNKCRITDICKLKHVLTNAKKDFFKVLNNYTIQDIIS